MVSSPVTGVGEADFNEECDRLSGPWTWDPEDEEYERVRVMGVGRAYWVKVGSSCSFRVEGTPPDLSFVGLKDGWNMVATTDTPIQESDIETVCDRESGPWTWDATEEDYERVNEMNPTRGYWVKVSGDCQVTDRDVEAEAEWDFLVAEGGETGLTAFIQVGVLDLKKVGDVNRVDRYTVEVDVDQDGKFGDRSNFGIVPDDRDESVFDVVFNQAPRSDTPNGEMQVPLRGHGIQPWVEPVTVRWTFDEPMLIPFHDRDVYRFVEAGDSKTHPVGDANVGCREVSEGEYTCRDLGITLEADFTCDGTEHSVKVNDIRPDENEARFFYGPTTTWKTVGVDETAQFEDSEGAAVFEVTVDETGIERGWKITTFTVTCAG